MDTRANTVVSPYRAFVWVALATCALLCIPLVAMQFTSEVNWTVGDFVVMGILLFGAGSIFVLVSRRVAPKYRVLTGALVLIGLLYVWAELAVGIFTDLGS